MKHWFVYNPYAGKPTVAHKTKKEASQEAERLAKINTGCFYVLETVEVWQRPVPQPICTPCIDECEDSWHQFKRIS